MIDSLPMVLGLSGATLTDDERHFFKDNPPWGFILFDRNIENEKQLCHLTDELKKIIDPCYIFIDQEGGRVARLRPPLVRTAPPMFAFARCYQALCQQTGDKNLPPALATALHYHGTLQSAELRHFGINGNMTPVLDILMKNTHDVIGDRALGESAEAVIAIATPYVEAMIAMAVLPVMKHIPGHGRAQVDSHHDLPIITTDREELRQTDFRPFQYFSKKISDKITDAIPLAMTAHMVYQEIDNRPATTSPVIINDIIRGDIGFQGAIMTDDLSMKALKGSIYDKGVASLQAGCDILLHCNGDRDEMAMVARACQEFSGEKKPLANLANLYKKWQDNQRPAMTKKELDDCHRYITELLADYI